MKLQPVNFDVTPYRVPKKVLNWFSQISGLKKVLSLTIFEIEVISSTAAMQVEKRKLDNGKAPCTKGAPIVRQDLSGRPAI